MKSRSGKKLRKIKRTKKVRHIKRVRLKINMLPDVTLARVFQFAVQRLKTHFFTHMFVCTKWHRCSVNHPVLQFLRPHLRGNFNADDFITFSKRCQSLRFLSLNELNITDEGLRTLASSLCLSHFMLRFNKTVTSDGLQALGALTQLKTLHLQQLCHGEQHGIKLGFVTKLKYLQELHLDESKVTDVGLAGMYVCMHVCMHAYMCVCVYVSMDVCMHACVCMCVCMLVCMCVCMCVCRSGGDEQFNNIESVKLSRHHHHACLAARGEAPG